MRLLLDSSGAELLCALADAEGVYLEVRHPTGTPESRDIGGVAGKLLSEMSIAELDAIVVGTGQGTFIGTRVALSYANGLAAAAAVPLFAVSSLAAICAVHGAGRSVVLRDARRGELYCYRPDNGGADCRLLAVAALARELVAHGITTVVLEQPLAPPGQPAAAAARTAETLRLVAAQVAEAGAQLTYCPGVPAEGLRRLLATAPRVDYAEPVYLRGFL